MANSSRPINPIGGRLLLLGFISLSVAPLLHAEITPFGERVNSNSVPDSPTSTLPTFPAVSAPPDPYALTPKKGEIKSSSFDLTSPQKNNKPPSAQPKPMPVRTPAPVAIKLAPLIERTQQTWQKSQPEIDFFLRLPEGHTTDHPTARGVLAFCTWQRSKAALRSALQNENSSLVKYAKRNHLALLTWNTAILWKSWKKGEKVDSFKERELDRDFDAIATRWKVGVEQLCKEQGLPSNGILLDGFSAGAHWSERLAIRVPKMFLAVHIHVANNYERISDHALGPLWAVSSGDLDIGKDSSVAFYRECQAKGFPIILKVCNGLGHASNSEIERFRDAFFDYALAVANRAGQQPPSGVMLSDLNGSRLIGDFLTQEVYHDSSVNPVPLTQRVPLPDVKVAKAWGYLRK